MTKFLVGLAIAAALILFTPAASSAASKPHGLRGADQYEFSSQRYRRAYRRAVYVRPAYRPWRRAALGPRWGYRRAAWAPGWGYRRAVWGPGWGYARPWRASYGYSPYAAGWGGYSQPWGWGYRPWGWAGPRPIGWGFRPWGWNRGWGGWGRGLGVGFYW